MVQGLKSSGVQGEKISHRGRGGLSAENAEKRNPEYRQEYLCRCGKAVWGKPKRGWPG
jgi:hypothetical protein